MDDEAKGTGELAMPLRFAALAIAILLFGPAALPQSGDTVTLSVPGQTRWLDTGVDVSMRQAFDIAVEGKIQWNKDGHQMCGPTGAVPYTRWGHKPILGINTGALIGKIGADSTDYFYIGAGQQAIAFASGRLFLGINDDNVLDNDGAFQVRIHASKNQ
jgi:hypothetical protein